VKWFILLVGIVVTCGVAALLLGRLGGGLGSPTSTLSHEPLPDDALTDDDLEQLRFDVALRGYRMGQVDGVLARLRRELREKDEELSVLRAGRPAEGEWTSGGATGTEHLDEQHPDGQPEHWHPEHGEPEQGEPEQGEPEQGEPEREHGEPEHWQPTARDSAKAQPRAEGP
jgi:DivIVA domain-containing protein